MNVTTHSLTHNHTYVLQSRTYTPGLENLVGFVPNPFLLKVIQFLIQSFSKRVGFCKHKLHKVGNVVILDEK